MSSSILRRSLTLTVLSAMSAMSAAVLPCHATDGGGEEKPQTIHSQPSFTFSSGQVEVAVTRAGGHMAPVVFYRDSDHPVQPYYISPWQDEPASEMPVPVLVPLRGDFFCMPFGGNAEEVQGEKHPPHGETAGSPWNFVGTSTSGDVTTMTLMLKTAVRKGSVTKQLSLVEGHNAVYSLHVIKGFSGRTPLGHHATLAMPDELGSVRIATSPIEFGMTHPGLFSNPVSGEYQALQPGARWTDLSHVPMAWKDLPDADLSRMPGRYGYADLIQLFPKMSEKQDQPAWVTATFVDSGFLWFSLKDPRVLRSTVFWMENHGRHGHPWNGRNNCLGLEDVTACFDFGLSASVSDNLLTRQGIVTAVELSENAPMSVNYIQGVIRIPAGFDVVKEAVFTPGSVTFVSAAGMKVTAPVRHEFLKTGRL